SSLQFRSDGRNRCNLELRVMLAMTVHAAILLAALELDDLYLPRTTMFLDISRHCATFEHGCTTAAFSPSVINRTSSSSIVLPGSASSFSTRTISPSATRYCLPPVRITACMTTPEFGCGSDMTLVNPCILRG